MTDQPSSTSEEMQKLMDASVSADMMGVQPTLLGRQIRPITLASITLLKQAKSPLIEGVSVEAIDNVLLECCIFMVLQTGTLKDATKLAFGDRASLVEAALDFAESIPPDKVQSAVDSILGALKDSTSTKVKAEPKKGEAPDPSGNS